MKTRIYPSKHLRDFCVQVFLRCEVPEEDAMIAADVLSTADLWGIDSHGVARLRSYYEVLERGLVNPRPQIRIVRALPGTATIDGDNGLGLVVGPRANELAMEKAEATGSGWVNVCNSSHFGIAGYYTWQALSRDLIGWAMTNTAPLVSPLWGAERMLGTNPISVAFPAREEPPVIVDFATSAISFGTAEIAMRNDRTLPDGLMIDSEGRPTNLPSDVVEGGGALLPLGLDRISGGHKGYCLSSMVDILCGVLGGANWGPFIPPFPYYLKQPSRSVGKGWGHLFGALKIEGFIAVDEFKQRMDEWVSTFRAAVPAPGTEGPLIPGDPERKAEASRKREGVPLTEAVVGDLRYLAARTEIPFD